MLGRLKDVWAVMRGRLSSAETKHLISRIEVLQSHLSFETNRSTKMILRNSELLSEISRKKIEAGLDRLMGQEWWKEQTKTLIRHVRVRHNGFAAVRRADCRILDCHESGPQHRPDKILMNCRTIACSIDVDLTAGCPPEFVAQEIADLVRAKVLDTWAHQSMKIFEEED